MANIELSSYCYLKYLLLLFVCLFFSFMLFPEKRIKSQWKGPFKSKKSDSIQTTTCECWINILQSLLFCDAEGLHQTMGSWPALFIPSLIQSFLTQTHRGIQASDKKPFQNTDLSILQFLWYFEFPCTISGKTILTTLNNASTHCCSRIAKSLLVWQNVKQIKLQFFWMLSLKPIGMSGKGFPHFLHLFFKSMPIIPLNLNFYYPINTTFTKWLKYKQQILINLTFKSFMALSRFPLMSFHNVQLGMEFSACAKVSNNRDEVRSASISVLSLPLWRLAT